MQKKSKILFILIIFLAFLLRFIDLGKIPSSLRSDEAAIGYNAYSILKTQKDEFGQKFPLAFQSFNDYKTPLYIYLTVPSIYFFGLNEWSIRLPSAIAGTLTVILVYFLVKELFHKSYKSYQEDFLPLISSLLLAVSPWHIFFSRTAMEANLASFLTVLAVYLFLKSRQYSWLLIFSLLLLALTLYAYHSSRVFTPFIVFGLIIFARKHLLKIKKWCLFSLILFLVLSFPILKLSFSKEVLTRAEGISSLSSKQILSADFYRREFDKLKNDRENNRYFSNIFHNRRIAYIKVFLQGYLSHFDFNFLFLEPTSLYFKIPAVGLLYFWELPFLILGFYSLFKNKADSRHFILWWVLIAPLASAVATETPHPVRSNNFIPVLQIITSYGIISFLRQFSQSSLSKWLKKLTASIILFFLLVNFIFFLHQYWTHFPYESDYLWHREYKDLAEYLKKEKGHYDKIFFLSKKGTPLTVPHIFVLYYFQYNPFLYQKEGGTQLCDIGSAGHYGFGHFQFLPIDCHNLSLSPKMILSELKEKSLVVSLPGFFPKNEKNTPLKTIFFHSGKPAFEIFYSDNLLKYSQTE